MNPETQTPETITRFQVEQRPPGATAWNQIKPVLERMDFAVAIAETLHRQSPDHAHRVAQITYTYFPMPALPAIGPIRPIPAPKRASDPKPPKGFGKLKFGKAAPKPSVAAAVRAHTPATRALHAGSIAARIMDLAPTLPAQFSANDLLKHLPSGITNKMVADRLCALRAQGRLTKAGHGQYSLPGAKSQAAAATLAAIHHDIQVPRDPDVATH